ncbi:serine/threonine-protein kinase RIO3-like [Clavelina lepadiformis]|uniref:serine/threonine-protein kinase RIO3-like n=1 Tax=Clavelina lepadiformis TaxID=159417 RepID=UPI0040428586
MSSSSTLVESSAVLNDQPESSSRSFDNTTSASPWCKSAKTTSQSNQAVSFEDVMSEQLASQLQVEENTKLVQENYQPDTIETEPPDLTEGNIASGSSEDTSNDALLAQMLQAEMDKEYNKYIAKQERQVNKNSKVKLSFTNYRTDEMFVSEEDDDEDLYSSSDEDIGSGQGADPSQNILEIKNDKGYVIFGKEVVTKHDSELCGRRNTARLEDGFPLQFRTGDATGMDIQLNNKIYNSLKKHAFSEQRRSQRLHEDKEHYTAEHAVDERTRLILHRLVDRGIIASVNGVISIGKEAVVIHADGGDIAASDLPPVKNPSVRKVSCLHIPKECAIKIYKTTLNEFRSRDKYIKDDYRFKDRFKKLNPRKIIHMWAEKEMHNLLRMHECGIDCPEVILLRKHVLVMSFIGHNQQPAPKLKQAILSSSQKKLAYEQVVNMMKKLYHECRLVHSDLSEFNLLWHDGKVWMIDVSQSVEPSHPHGLEFLLRDCTNISKFFNNLGVPAVLSSMELFNEVSGLNIATENEAAFLSTIETLEKSSEEHSHQGRNKSSQILEQSAH